MDDKQWVSIEDVRQLAATYRQKAAQCQEFQQFIQSPLGGMFWESPAAGQYRESMSDFVKMFGDFQTQFTDLATDLEQRANLAEETEKSALQL